MMGTWEMAEGTAYTDARKRMSAPFIAGIVAVLIAAFVVVFAITVASSTSATTVAGNVVPAAVQAVGPETPDGGASDAPSAAPSPGARELVAAGAALPAQDAEAVGETIADDETPLAAYSANISEANPLDGFTWILLAGIAGAAVFFLLSTRRMGKDISRMRSSIR